MKLRPEWALPELSFQAAREIVTVSALVRSARVCRKTLLYEDFAPVFAIVTDVGTRLAYDCRCPTFVRGTNRDR